MANPHFLRTASTKKALEELRLQPPPDLPESLMRAFPGMRDWNRLNQEATKRNHESIRRVMSELTQRVEDLTPPVA